MREALAPELGQPDPERAGESRAEEAQVSILGPPGTFCSALGEIRRRSAQVLGGPGIFTWGPASAKGPFLPVKCSGVCRSGLFGSP